MISIRSLHPTNRKVRLAVGLLLTGLFCLQCTQSSEADPIASKLAVSISGKTVGGDASAVERRVKALATSSHADLLAFCRRHVRESYRDYTCTFIKQEKINGKLRKPQTLHARFLADPYSVALKWVENPDMADRALFVQGKYGDQMVVRPTSSFLRALVGGSVLRKPDGEQAMKYSLRPINAFGFGKSLADLERVYRAAEKAGHLQEEFVGFGTPELTGRRCAILKRTLPPEDDYPAKVTHVYIDLEYLVPTVVEGLGWDDELSCRYVFTDIRFNTGLTDEDFLPQNNDIPARD